MTASRSQSIVPSDVICQQTIQGAVTKLNADVRRLFGRCVMRGVECLLDATNEAACCDDAARRCGADIETLNASRRNFENQVLDRSCRRIPFEDIVGATGLDFGRVEEACQRLTPPVQMDDRRGLAHCLRRLIEEDVEHLMTSLEIPRAAEALGCMALDDDFAGALRINPATCVSQPGGTPQPTPIRTPRPTSTPRPATPTPRPTTTGSTGPTPTPGSGGPTPTPRPTATGGIATPTPISGGPTPTPVAPTATPTRTPAPTPTAGAACSGVSVTMTVNFNQTDNPDVAGIQLGLKYPGSAVSIPGFGGDSQVLSRVDNLSGVSGGLFSASDDDANPNNSNLSVGLVSLGTPIGPGNFARARFDCLGSAPASSAFSCTVTSTSRLSGGNASNVSCSLTVTTQ
jgi:hypothetical protein